MPLPGSWAFEIFSAPASVPAGLALVPKGRPANLRWRIYRSFQRRRGRLRGPFRAQGNASTKVSKLQIVSRRENLLGLHGFFLFKCLLRAKDWRSMLSEF